jgi:hypothetical protein
VVELPFKRAAMTTLEKAQRPVRQDVQVGFLSTNDGGYERAKDLSTSVIPLGNSRSSLSYLGLESGFVHIPFFALNIYYINFSAGDALGAFQ